MLGGVSFAFPGTDMRIQVKRTSARGAFIRLALGTGSTPEERNRSRGGTAPDHRGYFVDVSTIGGALFGRKLSLGTLAELLGTEHRKSSVDFAGLVDAPLLDYAANDVQVTWECFVALRDRYAAFGLTGTPLWRLHSEASLGKAHLREMGLTPWRAMQPDFPPDLLAAILETYYGGRVECGIRGVAVPGVLVDFTSQYPTVSALMQMWPYHVATGIEAIEGDPAEVQARLDHVTVDDVLDPAFWPALHAIVLVDPAGCRLLTRAHFARPSRTPGRRPRAASRNVALPIRRDHTPQWWTLADAVAAVLEGDKAPRILRVVRFRRKGAQANLQPIEVAGDPRYRVDPLADDFVRRLVELRTALRQDARAAQALGDERRARELEARAGSLKKSANSIAYGVPIEVDVTDFGKTIEVRVARPDGSTYDPPGVHRLEAPGTWFHPLVATLVVAGGRLLLAAAMRLVHDAGGTYAFTDTDSLFVVATRDGGLVEPQGVAAGRAAPVSALSWGQVDGIVERFDRLNPYDRNLVPGSILALVDVNFDPDTGERREIWCYAIAAKRYTLFTLDSDGRPHIAWGRTEAHRSEHALGHLLSPYGRVPGRNAPDWVSEWWEYLLCRELEVPADRPSWFHDPAYGALSVTSAQDERAFRRFNAGRPYAEQVRPWGFVMTAHPHHLVRAAKGPRVLVTPREDDPAKRVNLVWFDRADPSGSVYGIRTGDPTYVVPGSITVASYSGYFEEFRRHPESKAAGPDGEPCHPWTRGQLGPLEVEVTRIVRIGKETPRLAVDPRSGEASSFSAAEYRERTCAGCGQPIARDCRWCSEACRKKTARRLRARPRTCGRCGTALRASQRKWCSEACRKRAARARPR
jgi:predicted nucleic acid-binding Zn ribbon protein